MKELIASGGQGIEYGGLSESDSHSSCVRLAGPQVVELFGKE